MALILSKRKLTALFPVIENLTHLLWYLFFDTIILTVLCEFNSKGAVRSIQYYFVNSKISEGFLSHGFFVISLRSNNLKCD